MSFSANGEIFTLYYVKFHTWKYVIVHMKNNNLVFTSDNHATSWAPNIGAMGYQGQVKKLSFNVNGVEQFTALKTVIVLVVCTSTNVIYRLSHLF